jgi:transcriptional regulator with XRE-family HTH domain
VSKLRKRLQEELDKHEWNSIDLELASGVPQTITERFLRGKQGDPFGDAIERWAKGFGISEESLRGFDVSESEAGDEPGHEPEPVSAVRSNDFVAHERDLLDRYRNADPQTQAAVDLLLLPDSERDLLQGDTIAAIMLLEEAVIR